MHPLGPRSLRIRHLVHLDGRAKLHVAHVLRRDQDVLPVLALLGVVDLAKRAAGQRAAASAGSHESPPSGRRTSMLILSARLCASMNTSNSSRHLMGDVTDSQSARSRQMVE